MRIRLLHEDKPGTSLMLPACAVRVEGPGVGRSGVGGDVLDGIDDKTCERLIYMGWAVKVEPIEPIEEVEEVEEVELPPVRELAEHLADKPPAYVVAMRDRDERSSAAAIYRRALE